MIAEEALMSDRPKFTPGDRVEVVNGAFVGMKGTVANPAAGNGRYLGHDGQIQVERYWVWLRVYGRQTLIRFLANQLKLTEGTA
jgi:transcription antitermination factor NusG